MDAFEWIIAGSKLLDKAVRGINKSEVKLHLKVKIIHTIKMCIILAIYRRDMVFFKFWYNIRDAANKMNLSNFLNIEYIPFLLRLFKALIAISSAFVIRDRVLEAFNGWHKLCFVLGEWAFWVNLTCCNHVTSRTI